MVNRSVIVCVLVATLTVAAPARAAVFPFFEPPEPLGATADRIVALDFNGDGWADVAGVRGSDATLVLNGEEEFADAQTVTLGSQSVPVGVAGGDLDGDGRDEFVTTLGDSGSLVVFRGRATGGLGTPDVYALRSPEGAGSTGVAVADVDGDGDRDIVAGFGDSATVMVNDGHGALTPSAGAVAIPRPYALRLVKLAGDDDPDLVILSAHALTVLPGAAGAGFGSPVTYNLHGGGTAFDAGDIDGDGRPDVAVSYETRYEGPDIFRGTADAGLAPLTGSGRWASALALADFDGDGAIDEYVTGYQPGFATGSGTFAWLASAESEQSSLESALAVADFDHDGKLDVASAASYTGDVAVRYSTGPQLVPSDANTFLGEATIGYRGPLLAVPIMNEGGGVARDLEPVVEGDTDDFRIDMDTCRGAVLTVEENCWIYVHFEPKTTGDKAVDVGLVAPDSRILWTVTLDGTAKPAPQPEDDTPTGQQQLWIGANTPQPRPRPVAPTPPRIAAVRPGTPSFTRPTLASLRRSGLRITQTFGTAERVTWTLESRGTVLARARRTVTVGRTTVTLKLTYAGKRVLAKRKPATLTLRAKGTLERVATVRLRRERGPGKG